MRNLLRIPTIVILLFCTIAATCSPATLANHAESVGKYALKTKPFFESIQGSEKIVQRIDQISADTKILASALRSSDSSSILKTTAAVIEAIEALIEQDAQLIGDPKLRTRVIGFLTSAEIALGIIVDSFPNTHHAFAYLTQEQKEAIAVIKKFKSKVRCRASGPVKLGDKQYQAGQFVPMRACKEFPDNTQVERIKK